jgi:hypothetical protein
LKKINKVDEAMFVKVQVINIVEDGLINKNDCEKIIQENKYAQPPPFTQSTKYRPGNIFHFGKRGAGG